MLEKPDIADESIIACLQQYYDIIITKLAFLPIGNDATAWVYRVDTTISPYFLKVKKGPLQASVLTIPHFLKSSGIKEVVAPLPNQTQILWTQLESFNLILYPFVEGQMGMALGMSDEQWREFGRVLKQIHHTTLPPELWHTLPEENFIPAWSQMTRDLDTRIHSSTFTDPHERELAAFWKSKSAEINRIVERTEALGRILQNQSLEFVLCHSDIHTANILLDVNGHLHMVDWDGVCRAPIERDLMFIDQTIVKPQNYSSEAQHFFEGYGATQVNVLAYAYYRYEWVVQEFGDFGERVFLTDNTGDETRADSVRGFKQLFDTGDVIDAAYAAEKNIINK